jgi:hypothetical protein
LLQNSFKERKIRVNRLLLPTWKPLGIYIYTE